MQKIVQRIGGIVTGLVVTAGTVLAQAPAPPKVTNPVQGSFQTVLVNIINGLLVFAAAVAILFLIVGGFRYVTSTGNAEQVEAAKKTVLYAIIGLIIIFIAFVGVQIILSILNVKDPTV